MEHFHAKVTVYVSTSQEKTQAIANILLGDGYADVYTPKFRFMIQHQLEHLKKETRL